jgi:hypothetical protein
MKQYVIEMKLYLETKDDADPEEVASTMDAGAARQLEGFPSGDLLGADVELIREPSEDERRDHFEE